MSNQITVVGRLTDAVDTVTTNNGKELAKFSVADNYGKDKVIFHNAVVFDERLVGFSKNHLKKGSYVFVSGRLEDDSFDHKDTGQKIKRVKIVVASIDFVNSGKSGDSNGNSGGGSNKEAAAATAGASPSDFGGDDQMSDEIPF